MFTVQADAKIPLVSVFLLAEERSKNTATIKAVEPFFYGGSVLRKIILQAFQQVAMRLFWRLSQFIL